MAYSSDEIIKREIIDALGQNVGDIFLRIFPQSSRADQQLFANGGLTFGINGVSYGSCDAVWFRREKWTDGFDGKEISETPILALEGTDALNRNSGGNALYQRFHHALGAVRNGLIGVYYLKRGKQKIQPDLYGMAYFASQIEAGYYLITEDLNDVLEILKRYGNEDLLLEYLDSHLEKMHAIFQEKFERDYRGNWENFANRRSTIIFPDYVIKHAGRSRRNFIDGSQRAGHIAVGEMFLTKYYFSSKKVLYLFPRMDREDLEFLDNSKKTDKEWFLLRNEPGVTIVTRDDLVGLTESCKKTLWDLRDLPLKGDALRRYKECVSVIESGFRNGNVSVHL